MKTITEIQNAAQEVASYIDLMRLPNKNEPIAKYASINMTGSKPQLKDDGFMMLSPKVVKQRKIAKTIVTYGLFPLTTALGIVNGMNATQKSGRVFNYGVAAASLLALGFNLHESRLEKKAPTLVFPNVK